MKYRGNLTWECYEDALLALLMQELGEEKIQAARAKQDWLQEEAGEETTSGLDHRCLGMVRRHYGKAKARKAGKVLWKVVSRVAVAACLAMALFAVAFATSETVQVKTINLLIDIQEQYTDFHFMGAEDRGPILSVGWIPEGYTLTKEYMDPLEVAYDYYDAAGNLLSVSCEVTDGLVVGFDTEDAVVENVTIQGCKGMLIEKKGAYHLVWTAKNNTRLISVYSYALSKEETFAVAETLVYD